MLPEIENHSIFDSHAHYNDERFGNTASKLIEELYTEQKVGGIINCGVDVESGQECIDLAHKFPFCYAAVGYHAENLPSGKTADNIEKLKPLISDEKVIAVGEIGLDYYWDTSKRDAQLEYFEKQLEFAKQLNLPVIVHDREAHADTLALLTKHRVSGVVHCFSGSVEMAREIVKLGMYIGIGGVVTFKNAKKVCEVVLDTPLERILLETDAPYMAPEPFRGKTCHSGMIAFTAKKIAEIKNVPLQTVIDTAAQNTKKLFNLR